MSIKGKRLEKELNKKAKLYMEEHTLPVYNGVFPNIWAMVIEAYKAGWKEHEEEL